MKNIALETMIDLAEEKLKISIRKSLGPNSDTAAAVLPPVRAGVPLRTVWEEPAELVRTAGPGGGAAHGRRPGAEAGGEIRQELPCAGVPNSEAAPPAQRAAPGSRHAGRA
ncbi:MAG: hypothetical protein GC192_04415 [Bacteroidetes bacterium]|nr:hypothetical protein [Bacteroidota bacterium]